MLIFAGLQDGIAAAEKIADRCMQRMVVHGACPRFRVSQGAAGDPLTDRATREGTEPHGALRPPQEHYPCAELFPP